MPKLMLEAAGCPVRRTGHKMDMEIVEGADRNRFWLRRKVQDRIRYEYRRVASRYSIGGIDGIE